MADMDRKKRLSAIDWTGTALFGFGAAGTIGSVEWAEKTNQAAYWPGYFVNLPLFLAGVALLLWNNRR
jgi:hypothetical protein